MAALHIAPGTRQQVRSGRRVPPGIGATGDAGLRPFAKTGYRTGGASRK